jgi:uncharacterized phage infection (PIP) family protein YhgE
VSVILKRGIEYIRELAEKREAAKRIARREAGAKVTQLKEGNPVDPSNPPNQADAADTLSQIADLLGVDPSDQDALQKAFAALLAAAGGTTEARAWAPKVVNQSNLAEGKRRLRWNR